MSHKRQGKCEQCGESYFGYGRQFCSVECRQKYRNHPARNPAKQPKNREAKREWMTGNLFSLGREVRDSTREKIAAALRGRKQPAEQTEKMVSTLRRLYTDDPERLVRLRAHMDRIRPRGENHHNWNVGVSKQRDKEFGSPQYNAFRDSVLERDGYVCQWCGSRKQLQVHHVKPYASHPNLRFDPDNGLTLCVECHNTTKRGQPRPKTG
jgi:5-methylcytosine-specific restriction endonuclease McrA